MKKITNRVIALLLVVALLSGFAVPASASGAKLSFKKVDNSVVTGLDKLQAVENREEEITYKATDKVRVSIVLEEKSTVQAGYSTMGIAQNEEAMEYNRELFAKQQTMAETISAKALNGKKLDVVWNMTLVGNIISANVTYGKIEAIKAIDGVKSVVIEQRYEPEVVSKEETAEPQMYTSGSMIGSFNVWNNGYTGAGSRVAIIDTGSDTDHQSLDNGAFLYALQENAAAAGKSYEEYVAGLDMLDAEEIDAVAEELNAYERTPDLAIGEKLYLNEKIPFGYNYIDEDLDIVHDNDTQGEHGSHVAGIATANRYIPEGEGYVDALESVFTAGVAPDAQLITMKVFGKKGGAYDSDYMAAIEDAIILGCDSVNLSLGSANPGVTYDNTYGELLAYLEETDTVVVTSGGNSGYWAENAALGYLYNDSANFATGGTPGSFPTVFSVASVDNAGTVGYYFTAGGINVVYTETTDYTNLPMRTLDTSDDASGTEYDYIMIDGFGQPSDYEGMDLAGKFVFCSRGETSFFEKGNAAAELGAAAIVIVNNQPGVINMDLTDYEYPAPCVSILQTEGAAIKAASEVQTTEGGLTYYTGKLTVAGKMAASYYDAEYYTMSSFSSWGVPGDLSIKPEITAPGGSIYSLNGVDTSGKGYELMSGTSMAAPQVTGMVALVAQYLRETGLKAEGLTDRALAQSLLMSTAEPLIDGNCESYYSILNQGSGLARVDMATSAESYILVDGMSDGKVKVQLGDDPDRVGEYKFSFSINNLNGEEMQYNLAADLFTQDVFSGGQYGLMLDTWTRLLPADVVFEAEGVQIAANQAAPDYDVNGDGVTDELDAQYILDYAVGNETELKGNGDVNGDEAVNTYDAHLLLVLLQDEYVVTVPANGSVSIDVTLALPEEVKAFFDAYYPNGAYVEAYVYAAPVADAEGNMGVVHSIPVLGFYGGWTESSMFDVGSYIDYSYDLETRPPYLYNENDLYGNTMSIDYGDGDEYYFGGNPLLYEDEYLPERNAMNNENGSALVKQYFALIRNAAGSKLLITDTKTGEVYLDEELGEIDGAYYYVNGAQWRNTQSSLKLNWKGTDANGDPLPEGTSVEIAFGAAPELYRAADGSIDWDAVGEGAYLRNHVTIDNTAPEITEISANLAGKSGINVAAKDNQYIACISVMNSNGTQELAYADPGQTVAGEEVRVSFEEINASKFLVVVYDYAMNTSTYEVTMQSNTEDTRPYFTAIDYLEEAYIGFEADGTVAELASSAGRYAAAAEYVDGYVVEVTDENNLYIAEDSDLTAFNYISNLDPDGELAMLGFLDLAFNKADGKLYGLYYSEHNWLMAPYLCTIDMLMGKVEPICEMPIDVTNIAIDGEGNFYSTIYGGVELYTYTVESILNEEADYIGNVGEYACEYINSMAWDHNADELYWAYGGEEGAALLKIDIETAEPTELCTFETYLAGLYIRPVKESSNIFAPTDEVVSVEVTPAEAATVKGGSVQLSAQVWPWTISDDSVIWSSSDESIATVDANGLVTGAGQGTAIITATSVLDPTKSASSEVSVVSLNRDLNGLVWDEEGYVWWSKFNTDTLPAYEKLTEESLDMPMNAVAYGADGILYATDLDTEAGVSTLYTVDPATLEPTAIGTSSIAYTDLACAPNLEEGGVLMGTYFNYITMIDSTTGDYVGAWDWSSNELVGIAYYGSVLNTVYNEYVDIFFLVDNEGYVYQEGFINLDGSYYTFFGEEDGLVGRIAEPVDISYFQSAYYDGTYFYWSRFNEADNEVELLVWDCDDTNNIYSMGTFAEGVWPVGGLFELEAAGNGSDAVVNEELANASVKAASSTEAIERVELNKQAKGSLNAAKLPRLTGTEVELDRGSVELNSVAGSFGHDIYVDVTADVPSTNGLIEVTYDPEALTFVEGGSAYMIAGNAAEGKVVLAYAAAEEISAEASVATLQFAPNKAHVETEVIVKTLERNDEAVEEEEILSIVYGCPSAHFEDVGTDSWYHEAVDFVVETGLMKGISDTKFNPNGTMDRAQMVTILYRLAGSPEIEEAASFSDVPADSYYADAVAWAQNEGIVMGVSDDLFAPKQAVSREQMVVFLARFAACLGAEIPEGGSIEGYEDADEVSSYAVDAMAWAIENGIISGVSATKLDPKGTSTRAQIAAVIMRFCMGGLNG